MADAGRDLVLGLGMGAGARRDEEAEPGRRELEFGARRCGRPPSPEPAVRLTLLPGLVPNLGLPWPPPSEATRKEKGERKSLDLRDRAEGPTIKMCSEPRHVRGLGEI